MPQKTKKDAPANKPSSPEIFVQFYYPEIKDLSKSFLTLVSGVLAFSVTFSTSIIGFPAASSLQLIILIGAWLFFIIAIISAGTGLYQSFVSANKANRAIILETKEEIGNLVRLPYFMLNVAGSAFVIGLILLASAGILKFI